VLVAWLLEHLPGPSLMKWKAYAALCNAGAGVALARLCDTLGLSRRAGSYAAWLAAFGFGSLYTLYDPHTSDPLMFLLGPTLMWLLLNDCIGRASVVATVCVFAKEFAAAPLWIFTIYSALVRQWDRFGRALFGAMTATLVWSVFLLWLTLKYNYSNESASTDLFGGGYLRHWASFVSPRIAASVLFAEFGAMFLLAPAGLWWAGQRLRGLAVASIPAVVALAYVQQPDRALWNFHFVVIPLSVIVLDALSAAMGWLFVAAFAVANLRFGAQLAFVPSARIPVAISLVVALVAVAVKIGRVPDAGSGWLARSAS
jgi:hypothetical protein